MPIFEGKTTNMPEKISYICPALLTLFCVGLAATIYTPTAKAHDKREPLIIEVPSLPRQPNSTFPVLYKCKNIQDCQRQAADFCKTFNYPNGKISFRDLPKSPRPFPVYIVICFD